MHWDCHSKHGLSNGVFLILWFFWFFVSLIYSLAGLKRTHSHRIVGIPLSCTFSPRFRMSEKAAAIEAWGFQTRSTWNCVLLKSNFTRSNLPTNSTNDLPARTVWAWSLNVAHLTFTFWRQRDELSSSCSIKQRLRLITEI